MTTDHDTLAALFKAGPDAPPMGKRKKRKTSKHVSDSILTQDQRAIDGKVAELLEIDLDYATPFIRRGRPLHTEKYLQYEEATAADKSRAKEVIEAAMKPAQSGYTDYTPEISLGIAPVEFEKAAEIKFIKDKYRPLDKVTPLALVGDQQEIMNDLAEVRRKWPELFIWIMPAAWTGVGKIYVKSYLLALGSLQQLIRKMFEASSLGQDQEPVKAAIREQFARLADLQTKIRETAAQED